MVKTSLKFLFQKVLTWAKSNPIEFCILLTIFLIGAFLRFYRIDEYMIFLGDEGRDVIIVRRFLTEAHPPLIGPGTSIGNMYLGPLYYYMMAPFLLLWGFSPVGPAVMVALLGVATIYLLWFVARELFGKYGALVSAGLYAIAPTVIVQSRSSWNPNIMPFFALLCVYAIWKVWKNNKFMWLIVLGISYAFVLQSHYFGLVLLPVLLLFWLLTLLKIRKLNGKRQMLNDKFWRHSVFGLVILLILMSPLVIFDLRHNWQNFSAIREFSGGGEGAFVGPIEAVKKFVPTLVHINTRLLAGRNDVVGMGITILMVSMVIWLNLKKKTIQPFSNLAILLAWFFVGLFGLSLYNREIFDHYMGFIFTAPFLLIGGFMESVMNVNKYGKIIIGLSIVFIVLVNLAQNPLQFPPNRQLQRSIEIADFIREKARGERLNLATISDRNNRDVYQYFLLTSGAKVVDTDPNAVFYTVTDQLFVVCEKSENECDPVHNPSAWITNFGWSKIDDHWQVAGVNIYKLSHTK